MQATKTSPIHTTRRTASDAIAARIDFNGSNITGRNGYAALFVGRLPREFQAQFNTDHFAHDFYVVRSYATPIAWFAHGEWTIPAVKYSPTTSNHQGIARRGALA